MEKGASARAATAAPLGGVGRVEHESVVGGLNVVLQDLLGQLFLSGRSWSGAMRSWRVAVGWESSIVDVVDGASLLNFVT